MKLKKPIRKLNRGNCIVLVLVLLSFTGIVFYCSIMLNTESTCSSGACSTETHGASNCTSAEDKTAQEQHAEDPSPASRDSGSEESAASSKTQHSAQHAEASADTPKSSSEKKTWVPAQYRTVSHEAVTHTVQKVKCRCGAQFDTSSAWLAHKNANGG